MKFKDTRWALIAERITAGMLFSFSGRHKKEKELGSKLKRKLNAEENSKLNLVYVQGAPVEKNKTKNKSTSDIICTATVYSSMELPLPSQKH